MRLLGHGQVWVEDRGGGGLPVVLLHPGWGDSTIWDDVVARLGVGVRVIRLDARGYGRSPAPQTPFSELGDLVRVLEVLGVERALVVGHSGGGATAVSLALAAPERLAGLILVAPGVEGYPWPADDPYLRDYASLLEGGDVAGLVELGLRTWARSGADLAARAQVVSGVAGQIAQGEFLRADPEAFSRIGEICCPVTLVLGGLEYPMVADCVAAMARRIPGSELISLPDVDHLVPLRRPDLLADLISRFHPLAISSYSRWPSKSGLVDLGIGG